MNTISFSSPPPFLQLKVGGEFSSPDTARILSQCNKKWSKYDTPMWITTFLNRLITAKRMSEEDQRRYRQVISNNLPSLMKEGPDGTILVQSIVSPMGLSTKELIEGRQVWWEGCDRDQIALMSRSENKIFALTQPLSGEILNKISTHVGKPCSMVSLPIYLTSKIFEDKHQSTREESIRCEIPLDYKHDAVVHSDESGVITVRLVNKQEKYEWGETRGIFELT